MPCEPCHLERVLGVHFILHVVFYRNFSVEKMADSHRMSLAQSHAHHGHSQSGLLDKFVGIAMSKAPLQKKRRAGIMKTKLSAREVEMAEEVWHMYVLSGFVRSFGRKGTRGPH